SNTGTDDLTLATATSSFLSNVTVNSISAPASTTVTPGNSTTFTVQYTPTIAGVFSFDLAFTNNDGDENSYNMTVSGTATGVPEIAVSSSESGAVADGGTDAQGNEAAGTAKTLTYTVSNTGTDDLTLATAMSSSLSNVTVNSISAPASTTVTPGNSTTFTVQYTPTIAGVFSFDLAFTNNDGDESPYNMTISGTATGAPEVAVSSSESGAVADGGTDAQGSEAAGSTKTVTYTVSNTGTDDLTLATAASSSLTNATVNSISAPGLTTVTPGNSTTFTVQYTPTLSGAFSFDLAFTNNDGDESPYNMTVSGTGTGEPEVAVSSSESGAVADGGTDAQGNEAAGTAKTVTYTVSNTGTDDLTLATATSSSLTNATVNSISAPGLTTVTPGNSTTFTVQYTPTLSGAFSFDLAFTNNDGDENPHNMTVSGTATGAPEIAVFSSESGVVADGGADAQGSEPAGTTKTVTYTVSNTGTDDLTLATATSGSLSNVTVNSISAPGSTTVTAGNSTTFTVQYTPTLAGVFSFDLTFTNNDGDENPYNMTVSGTATGSPEIAVSSSESGAVADGGTDAQGNEAADSAKTITYTVSNTGIGDLTLATATSSSLSNVTVNSISAPVSTTVTPGNSTTFTVQYTPTVAGAFTFNLAFTNNDDDENPYNMTVSGGASGAPEINVTGNAVSIVDGDVTPVVADHTDFGTTDITSGTVSRSFTIQNTGTDVLTLGANAASLSGANASDFTVSTHPSATVAPGGSTTLSVQFDPTAAGARNAVLTIANDDADENPYGFALAGEGISGGTVTIVQNIIGADVSVGLSSATPALNFTLTSVSGTAQKSLVGVPAGSHSLVAEDLASIGYGISSIACNDTDSTGDVVSRTATINLLSGEHVTCVFETVDTRGPTTQMIADFLGARNTLLLSNQPGSERRINRLKGGTGVSGGDSFQAFGHNLRSPLPIDVEIDDDSFSFATSLKRVMAAGGEASHSANGSESEDKISTLDIWIEGSASRFIDGTSGGGSFGLLSFGVDYLVEPDLLIGFMGQVDRFKQDFTTLGSEIDGRGWMAGPYATLKLDEHLYLDVLGTWGKSDNDISPFGTYTDTFETDRWLVSSTLTGQFDAGNWDIRPSYTLQFFHERQIAYTDSLGVRIPEQSLSQGDMRLGPQIAYTHMFEDGSSIRPKGGFEGVYSFGERNTFSVGSFAAETQGLTGQVNGGIDYQTPGGLSLGLTTDFGGIGGTAKSFGLTINLSMPLN
ncbi:MAG: choice-of-anchor D domain-containing protein, partial [Rhodobiaceae bacterium]|nr:choice-of-anchor D domain-containing protein [Rhodobiaceae bacterium]